MQSKNSFVAGLFVMALCGLFVGGIGLYKVFEFRVNGQPATMQLANPDEKIVRFEDSMSTRTVDVMYVSEAGNVVVPRKLVSNDMAERLFAGDGISIAYLANRPERVFYNGQQPQIPWGWLITGIVAMVTAVYALRLRKREAGQ